MKLIVPDMSCEHCVKRITSALKEIGIENPKFDLDTKEVSFDAGSLPEAKVVKALDDVGYSVK